MGALLAKGAWALDLVFFILIFVGIFLGVLRGFLKSICKLAGTIFSGVIAVTFCVSLQDSLEKSFGWTTKMNLSMHRAADSPLAKWIMIVLCFIFLALLVQLLCWGVGAGGTALADRYEPVKIINMVLGGIMGAFQMFVIIFGIFAILRWIPSPSLHDFISSTRVVGAIFNPNPGSWFYAATNLRSR